MGISNFDAIDASGFGPNMPAALSGVGAFASNANAKLLRKLVATARSGTALSGPFLIIGDSTDRGPNNVLLQSWPKTMVDMMNATGIPASFDSIFGASNATNPNTLDSRLAAGAGWVAGTADAAVRTAGGGAFGFPANTTPTALSFTPTNAYNQVDVYAYQNGGAGLGAAVVDRGGTAPTGLGSTGTPINMNTAPQAIAKYTVNFATVATGVFNLQVPNNASPKIRIVGIVCRDTTKPRIDVINAAWAASSSSDWIAGSGVQAGLWGPQAAVQTIAPAAIFYGHEVNDFNPGNTAGGNVSPTDLATFRANIQSYMTLFPGVPFIFLRKAQSDPTAFAADDVQQQYWAAKQSLASANGFDVFDFRAIPGITTYADANANGYALDQRHLVGAGYALGGAPVGKYIGQF